MIFCFKVVKHLDFLSSCRILLKNYGKHLGLDSRKVPGNTAVSQFAEALAKAWKEYNNSRLQNSFCLSCWFKGEKKEQPLANIFLIWFSSAVVLVVVQPEERNMYDQHWLSFNLKELYPTHPSFVLFSVKSWPYAETFILFYFVFP